MANKVRARAARPRVKAAGRRSVARASRAASARAESAPAAMDQAEPAFVAAAGAEAKAAPAPRRKAPAAKRVSRPDLAQRKAIEPVKAESKGAVAPTAEAAISLPEIALEAVEAVAAPVRAEVEAAAEPTEAAVEGAIEAAETLAEAGVELVVEPAAQAVATVVEQAEAVVAAAEPVNPAAKGTARLIEEASAMARENAGALRASSSIAASGLEEIRRGVAECGRKSFEDASSALESFAKVRSLTDLVRFQSDYARRTLGNLVETTKVGGAVLRLSGDVAAPIANRYLAGAERIAALRPDA